MSYEILPYAIGMAFMSMVAFNIAIWMIIDVKGWVK